MVMRFDCIHICLLALQIPQSPANHFFRI
jgi:hypothetical protein